MILVVEDNEARERAFYAGLTGAKIRFARTAAEAIAVLRDATPGAVFLDYDLGEDGGTGTVVAAWCSEHADRFRATQFFVHSLSAYGAPEMERMLRKQKLTVFRRPHAWEDDRLLAYVASHMGA